MPSIFHTFKSLKDIRNNWDEAVLGHTLPTLTYDWFMACEKAFSPGLLKVIVVRPEQQSSKICAAVPLAKRNCILGRCSYEILGEAFLHEPTGFIYGDEKSFKSLMHEIQKLKSPLLFQRIPKSLPIRQFFTRPITSKFIFIEKQVAGSQYLPLPGTIEELENRMSSRRRGDLNRIKRKAERLGELSSEIIQPDASNVAKTIQLAFETEHAGWKSKTGSSILSRAHIEKFFRIYLSEQATRGQLVVGFLKFNGDVVAMQIAIRSFGRIWLLKIGHNDKFKHISPGILMTHEMIRYAINEDMQAFEFLGHSESWINMWRPKEHEYKVALVFPVNISGFIHLVKFIVEVLVNKIFK